MQLSKYPVMLILLMLPTQRQDTNVVTMHSRSAIIISQTLQASNTSRRLYAHVNHQVVYSLLKCQAQNNGIPSPVSNTRSQSVQSSSAMSSQVISV